MLAVIRERSKGVVAWVVVVIIIIPFALFGLDQFTSGDRIEVAAKVNGEPIPASEFQRALDNVKRQYQESFGDMYASLVQEDKLREQVLTDLIQRSAIDQKMQQEGFAMSDQLLAQVIQSQQMFQDKGVFSVQRYDEVLKNNGFTKERFEQAQRQFMLRNQLASIITGSELIGAGELKALAALESQEREIGYLRIDHRPFLAKVSVDDAQIKVYYEQNLARFKSPEQVSVDYVRLSTEDLAKSIQVSDEQLQTYYKDHPEKFQLPEKRNVRHILIMSPQEASTTADNAKARIESLLAQIKQGADFAELAKANSEDPGSASRGGELGFFQRGDMVPEFEAAAFALTKEGELSEIVQTSYGYHLLQLVAMEKAKVPDFSEVKALLAQELTFELAAKAYNAKLEQLKTLTFEQDDSLKPAADKLGLTIQTSAMMTPEGGEGVFAAPQLLEAMFSPKVLKEKLNSAVIEVQAGESIVLRVNQHQESREKPLVEVSDEIRSLLQRQAAIVKAADLAKTLLSDVKKDVKALPVAFVKEGVEWKDSQWMTRNFDKVLPEILSAGFKAPKPAPDSASWVLHQLSTGDSLLIRVSAVRTDEAKLTKVADDLKSAAQQVFADAEVEALGKSIKDKAKIEIMIK